MENKYNVYLYDELPSTNSFLIGNDELLKRNYSVVRAIRQTEGRGRQNRKWVSSSKDLTFSYSCLIKKAIKNPSCVTIVVGLGVYRSLSKIIPNLKIKWPNDINYENKKLCGILTEMKYDSEEKVAVIGIGINVNSGKEELPENSISIKEISGKIFDQNILLQNIMNEQINLFECLDFPFSESLINEWSRSSDSIGKKVKISTLEGQEIAIIDSINNEGSLVIITENNKRKTYNGEVDFI